MTLYELSAARDAVVVDEAIAYLNSAYMGLRLHALNDAGRHALERQSRPWDVPAAAFFEPLERLRQTFASVIGCDWEGLVTIPSVSYGISTAARNAPVGPGDTIVVLDEQFPSNVYPWRDLAARVDAEVVTVPTPADPTVTWTDAVIAAMDTRTAVVAVPNVHWTDGRLVDLPALRRAADDVGAWLVVDASQSLTMLPIDWEAARPDMLTSVGYKWQLGPWSLSWLWVAPQHRDGEPLEAGWMARKGSDDFARLVDYTDVTRDGAERFQAGESNNFQLVPMAQAAAEQLRHWSVERIAQAVAPMTDLLERRTRALGLTPTPAAARATHLLGVRAPEGFAPDLPERLRADGVSVSVRGSAVRVSVHAYTTIDECERLVDVLAAAV